MMDGKGLSSSSARSEKPERVGDIGKNGRILFDRPKPTTGCSANGRRRRNVTFIVFFCYMSTVKNFE
jgi:hypothetical protein